MRATQLKRHDNMPLIIDNFCGGGGASEGMEQAFNRPVSVALNHDKKALSMHEVNHPHTDHKECDVFEFDIKKNIAGRNVGIGWFSPDCRHFSKAKGGTPVNEEIRGLANVIHDWGDLTNMEVVGMENVEEFKSWRPVRKGKPVRNQRKTGSYFRRFIKRLYKQGFTEISCRTLNCADYGAPTSRKRFFLIAKRNGEAVVWPAPTHFPRKSGRLPSWRPASTGIDWSIPCPSIFERKKMLVDSTCRRLAVGTIRHAVESNEPFIAPITPSTGDHGVKVAAWLGKHYTGVVGHSLHDPIGAITTKDHHSLVTAFLVPIDHVGGKGTPSNSLHEPLTTITSKQRHGLVVVHAFLLKYYGTGTNTQSLHDPIHTITTKERFGLVTLNSVDHRIYDIGFRMLQPHELFINQGFPSDYIIDRDREGNKLTKTKQTALCGNSVPPSVVKALMEANAPANCFA